jgi:hypothetical protein
MFEGTLQLSMRLSATSELWSAIVTGYVAFFNKLFVCSFADISRSDLGKEARARRVRDLFFFLSSFFNDGG